MRIVRDIWTDLVDKRLWPVAAALVLALIAIPVLLLEPAASPKAPPAPMADAGPAQLVTDPAAIRAARPSGPVTGDFKNPFDQQHQPKKDTTTQDTSSPAGPGTADTTGSGGGSAPKDSGGSGGSGNAKPKRPGSDQSADGVKRLKVRFGRTDGKRRIRILTPGQPLPSSTDPVLVFVEVGRRNRAEFLVSSDAVPQGDGRCEPTKAICAQLFAKPGDTQFFDVTRSKGVVQYQLEILDVIG